GASASTRLAAEAGSRARPRGIRRAWTRAAIVCSRLFERRKRRARSPTPHNCPFPDGPVMKRALVTGGSGDLGGAICRRLAAAHWHVIVHANSNLARAEDVVAQIEQAGGSAQAVAFDVADG